MPMRVWDNQANKARTVSEAEAQQGIAEGRFQIRSGIDIPVRNPEGEAYTISSDEAAKAFQKGWTLETPEQSKQVFDQAEEKARKVVAEDMEGTAFLQGALKTATFGLSDAAIQAGTDIEPEFQTAVAEENPIMSTLGEVAGALPVGGPAAAAARGTAALGARAATSKVGQKAVEFAADGLAYGMGESISDLALGRPEEVASNLILGGGIGGVLGAGTGALAPVAKAAKDAILTSAEKAVTVPTEKLASAVAKRKARKMGVEGAEELIESGRFRNLQDPDKIKSFEEMAEQAGIDVASYKQQEKQLGRDLRKFKKEYSQTLKDMQRQAVGEQKAVADELVKKAELSQKTAARDSASELGEAINDVETIATNTFAQAERDAAEDLTVLSSKQLESLRNTANDLALATESLADKEVAAEMKERLLKIAAMTDLPDAKVKDIIPDMWALKKDMTSRVNWARPNPTDYEKTLKGAAAQIDEAIKSTDTKTSSMIDHVNKLYVHRSDLYNMTRRMRAPKQQDPRRGLDIDRLTASILKDPEGKGQLGIVFNKMTDFYNTLDIDPDYVKQIQKKVTKTGEETAAVDTAKLFRQESITKLKNQLSDDLASFKSADIDEIAEMIMDMASSKVTLRDKADAFLKLQKAQEYIQGNPQLNTAEKYAHYAKVMGDKKGEERIQQLLQYQKDASIMDKLAGDKPGRLSDLGILSAIGLGGIDSGITALAVVKAAHLANSPKAALEVIPAIERYAETGRGLMDKFATGFAKAVTSKTAARTVVAPIARGSYESASKGVEENQDPIAFQNKLSSSLEPLAHAPNVQMAVMDKIVTTQQYLSDKLPKDPLAGQGLFSQPYVPSETQKNEWMRRYQVAENPSVILPKIENGTVTPEEVETFKTLYPELFEETKRRMVEQLSQLTEPPLYDKLVTLSFVFEEATDPTLNAAYITFMQESIANYPKEKVNSNKSLSKLDPETFMSDGQQVTMR